MEWLAWLVTGIVGVMVLALVVVGFMSTLGEYR